MTDLNRVIRGQRNALEALVQHVPGFRGYFDRENRREADRLVRDFGVTRLERLCSELSETTKQAALSEMDTYQETINQAETLRNALRHADQGYSGFFAEIKWDDEDALQAVYCLDLELVLDIEALVSDFDSGAPAPERLRGELVGLKRRLEDRRAAILGLVGE